jgi:thioesterase domain-containing protein
MTKELFTTLYSVAMANAYACRVYKPIKLPLKVNVVLFRAKDTNQDKPFDYGWNRWLQNPLLIHYIQANHFSIVDKDPMQAVAKIILEKYS